MGSAADSIWIGCGQRRRALAVGACLAVGVVTVVAVQAQPFMPPASPITRIESCVGTESFELRAGSDSVLLDEGDHAQLQAAMLQRYPMLGRSAFAPALIVLWRKPDAGWVYLALNAQADKPGKLCSAASFSASAFELTGPLLRKYFFGGRT